MIEDLVIWVDENDKVLGLVSRVQAHDKQKLLLHRETMELIYSDSTHTRFWLQKRSQNKEQKEHYLQLLIRAKGDSDKGDNNIYTFNRRAIIDVNGKKVNPVVGMVIGVQSNGANKTIGIGIVLAIVIIGLVIFKSSKKKKE